MASLFVPNPNLKPRQKAKRKIKEVSSTHGSNNPTKPAETTELGPAKHVETAKGEPAPVKPNSGIDKSTVHMPVETTKDRPAELVENSGIDSPTTHMFEEIEPTQGGFQEFDGTPKTFPIPTSGVNLIGPVDPSPAQQAVFIAAHLNGASSPCPDSDSSYTVRGGMLVFAKKTDLANSGRRWAVSGTAKRRLAAGSSTRVFANWKDGQTKGLQADDYVFIGVAVDNVVDGKGAKNNPTSVGGISVMVSGAVTVHCERTAAAHFKAGDYAFWSPTPCVDTFTQLPQDFQPVAVRPLPTVARGSPAPNFLGARAIGRVLETFPDQGAVRILLDTPITTTDPPKSTGGTLSTIRPNSGLLRGPVDGLAPRQPVFIQYHIDATDVYGTGTHTADKPHVNFMPAGVLAFTWREELAKKVGNFQRKDCRKVFSCINNELRRENDAGNTFNEMLTFKGVTVDPHVKTGATTHCALTVSGSVTIHVEPAELVKMCIGDLLMWDADFDSEEYSGHPTGYRPVKVIRADISAYDKPWKLRRVFGKLLFKADNERIGEAHVLLFPPLAKGGEYKSIIDLGNHIWSWVKTLTLAQLNVCLTQPLPQTASIINSIARLATNTARDAQKAKKKINSPMKFENQNMTGRMLMTLTFITKLYKLCGGNIANVSESLLEWFEKNSSLREVIAIAKKTNGNSEIQKLLATLDKELTRIYDELTKSTPSKISALDALTTKMQNKSDAAAAADGQAAKKQYLTNTKTKQLELELSKWTAWGEESNATVTNRVKAINKALNAAKAAADAITNP